MSNTGTPDRREEDDDWETRHARIRIRAEGRDEKPQVKLPDSDQDDWALRHAETKRGS